MLFFRCSVPDSPIWLFVYVMTSILTGAILVISIWILLKRVMKKIAHKRLNPTKMKFEGKYDRSIEEYSLLLKYDPEKFSEQDIMKELGASSVSII